MSNIVIIRSNPVNPDSRVEKIAWTLMNGGHNVYILAWDRSYNHPELNEFIEVIDKRIPISRLGYKASFGAGMRSIVPYLKFQFSMRRWLKKNKNKYDIIHSCDFDTAFFSYKLARRMKKKFVFDIFDMLATEPKNFFQKQILKAQKRIINFSDATIICTEQRKSQIKGTFPKRLEIIHNTPFVELKSTTNSFVLDDSKIKVVYVGVLQEDRMLNELLNFFKNNPQYEFHTAGFGKLEDRFIEYSKKYNNIFFYGKIRYNQTLELEQKCDIMLAIYNPNHENNRNAAPNKFYESLMLGKPIIMVRNTGMSSIVKDNDIGVLIDYSEEGFKAGIEELVRRRDEWTEISLRMKKIYDSEYNWSIMEKRLLNLYNSL